MVAASVLIAANVAAKMAVVANVAVVKDAVNVVLVIAVANLLENLRATVLKIKQSLRNLAAIRIDF